MHTTVQPAAARVFAVGCIHSVAGCGKVPITVSLGSPFPGCAAVRATPHVALFVSSPQQLALVQGQTQWRGPLIKAFMVSGACI